jgi:hypothetical protein
LVRGGGGNADTDAFINSEPASKGRHAIVNHLRRRGVQLDVAELDALTAFLEMQDTGSRPDGLRFLDDSLASGFEIGYDPGMAARQPNASEETVDHGNH